MPNILFIVFGIVVFRVSAYNFYFWKTKNEKKSLFYVHHILHAYFHVVQTKNEKRKTKNEKRKKPNESFTTFGNQNFFVFLLLFDLARWSNYWVSWLDFNFNFNLNLLDEMMNKYLNVLCLKFDHFYVGFNYIMNKIIKTVMDSEKHPVFYRMEYFVFMSTWVKFPKRMFLYFYPPEKMIRLDDFFVVKSNYFSNKSKSTVQKQSQN